MAKRIKEESNKGSQKKMKELSKKKTKEEEEDNKVEAWVKEVEDTLGGRYY